MTVQKEKKKVPALRFPGFDGEWEEKKFKELAFLQRGFDITEKQANGGNVPVYSSSGISYFHDEKKVDGPGVLTGRKGKLGKVFFIEQAFWPHDTTLWVKDFNGNDPKYTYWFLISFNLEKFDAATSVPTLNRNNLHGIKILTPTLPEQQKIAAFLTAIDTRIQQLTRKVDLLEQYKKGVMQQIFSQEIRFKPDSQAGSDDQGRDFPAWEEKRLGKILKEPEKPKVLKPDEIELLTVKLHCKGVEKTGKFPNVTKSGRPYYKRFKGEILIGRQNFHNGSMAIVGEEENGLICSNAISSFNVVRDNTTFILYNISRADFYKRVGNIIGGTGQKEISKKEFSKLTIKVPTLPEQQKIAAFLTSIDRKITHTKDQLEHMQRFKKGLLQQMFV